MAAIKTPDAHLLVIEPWDKGVLGAIEHAIMQSNIGVTPSNDGTCLRLPFPSLTEERRREFVKQCKTYSEEARVRIRAVRRDANDDLEKAEKGGDITEDEQRTGEKQVQKLTDQYVAKVDDLFKKKEAEIMTI
jgi:ribosome recycling factor